MTTTLFLAYFAIRGGMTALKCVCPGHYRKILLNRFQALRATDDTPEKKQGFTELIPLEKLHSFAPETKDDLEIDEPAMVEEEHPDEEIVESEPECQEEEEEKDAAPPEDDELILPEPVEVESEEEDDAAVEGDSDDGDDGEEVPPKSPEPEPTPKPDEPAPTEQKHEPESLNVTQPASSSSACQIVRPRMPWEKQDHIEAVVVHNPDKM